MRLTNESNQKPPTAYPHAIKHDGTHAKPIDPVQCQKSNRSNQPNHINHPNQSVHLAPCQISVFIRQSKYIILQRRKQTKSTQSINECNKLKTKPSQVKSKQMK